VLGSCHLVFIISTGTVLDHIRWMRCELLLSLIPASDALSHGFTQLCCVEMDERIEVRFGVKTFGCPWMGGPDPPR